MTKKFKIDGMAEVEKALHDLPLMLKAQALRQFNRDVARKITKNKLEAARPKHADSVGISTDRQDKTAIYVGMTMNAYYLRFMEFGTKLRKTRGKGKRANSKAKKYKAGVNRGVMPITRPFVEKTIDGQMKDVINFARKEYGNSISRWLNRKLKATNKKLAKI